DGRYDAGTPDARDDLEHLAHLFTRLELERVRPPRVVRCVADTFPGRHVLKLYDDAVDLVRKLIALLLHLPEVVEDPFDVLRRGVEGVHREAPPRQRLEELGLRLQACGPGEDVVTEDPQGSTRSELRVQLPNGPGSGVARVGERLLALVDEVL